VKRRIFQSVALRYACRSRSRIARSLRAVGVAVVLDRQAEPGVGHVQEEGSHGVLEDGDGQAVEHDDQPDPRLHRRVGQRVGQLDDLLQLCTAAGAAMPVAQVKDCRRGEPVAVAQSVDRDDGLHQRFAACQVVRGAYGGGDGDPSGCRDLVRLEPSAVDHQPGSGAA